MRRLSIFAAAALFLAASFASAQPPDTLWTRTYGGPGEDTCRCVRVISDGGFILAGTTNSFGMGDAEICLVKTDSEGNVEWERLYGGDGDEICYGVLQASDGGYFLWGESNSGGMSEQLYLVKVDSDGVFEWEVLRNPSNYYSSARASIQNSLGNYIVVVKEISPGPSAYIHSYDTSGNQLWFESLQASYGSFPSSLCQVSTGGYLVGLDYYGPPSFYSMYLIETDTSGIPFWAEILSDEIWDRCRAVLETPEGDFMLIGCENLFGSEGLDMSLIRTDAAGSLIWQSHYGGSSNEDGNSLISSADSGYVLAGATQSYGAGNQDMYLVMVDSAGNLLWQQTYGGPEDDACYSIAYDSINQCYALAGYTTSYGSGGTDMYLVCIETEGSAVGIEKIHETEQTPHNRFEIYPNPYNSLAIVSFELKHAEPVELSVYDFSGCLVIQLVDGWRDAGVHEVTFDGSDLPSGIYFARLTAGDSRQIRKLVLVK